MNNAKLALFKSVISLSTQLSLAQIAPLAMSFYIASLIGKFGALAFSSYSLVATVNLTVFIAAVNFLQSLYVVAGRAMATGDQTEYWQAIRAGAVVACGLAAIAMIVSCGIGALFFFLGMQAEIVQRSGMLGYASAFGIFPSLWLAVFRVHAVLKGRAGFVTWVYLFGALAASILATMSISKTSDATLPATLAIAAANWLMLAIAVIGMKHVAALKLVTPPSHSIAASIRLVIAIGWPIGAVVFLDSFAFLFAALFVGRFWSDYVPAHSAAALWLTICLVFPLGIAQAAVQKIAVLHARGNWSDRNSVASMAMLTGFSIAIVIAGIFAMFPIGLGRLLLNETADAAVVSQGLQHLMPLAGVLFVCQSMIVIAAAVLRGIGQTRASFIQAFIGYCAIATGAQLLFTLHFGQGVYGIWWGLICGFGATAIALIRKCILEFRINLIANEISSACEVN